MADQLTCSCGDQTFNGEAIGRENHPSGTRFPLWVWCRACGDVFEVYQKQVTKASERDTLEVRRAHNIKPTKPLSTAQR